MRNEEISSYMKAMLFIALTDHNLDKREMDHLMRVGKRNGLSEEDVEDLMYESLCSKDTLRDILDTIKDDKTKTELIGDLLRVCYADGHYSSDEWDGVSTIASLLGVDNNTLGKIHNRVKPAPIGKKVLVGAANAVKDAVDAGVDAGKFVADGGAGAIKALTRGISKVSKNVRITVASVKQIKEENIQLRKRLKEVQMSEALKQRIIVKLDAQIYELERKLQEEEQRADRHEDMIKSLNDAINEMLITKASINGKNVS